MFSALYFTFIFTKSSVPFLFSNTMLFKLIINFLFISSIEYKLGSNLVPPTITSSTLTFAGKLCSNFSSLYTTDFVIA
ncbi:hypothetical protein TCEA9_24500 [Thermobrachium celere]|nr:hypothetical protein TCEA9_24500 [Thermobrachium celere]